MLILTGCQDRCESPFQAPSVLSWSVLPNKTSAFPGGTWSEESPVSGNSSPLPEARAIDSSLWTTEAAFLTPGCPGCFAALKGKSTWEGATVGESQQPPARALTVQQAELGGGPSSKMATYVLHAVAPISGPLWERPPILQTGCIHLGRRNSSTGPFKQLRRDWNCEAPVVDLLPGN